MLGNYVKKLPRFLILNLILCFIMFFNIVIVKREMDKILIFIILSYISILFSNYFLNNKVFKGDDTLLFILNIFILISEVILYRINPLISLKQMIFIIIGYSIYLFIMWFIGDMSKFYKFKWIYFILTLSLMSLSFLFGRYINGSKNWISIFGVTFQPSEFGKIFLILYICSVLRDNRNKIDKYMSVFLISIIILVLILQKDLGSAMIVFIISMVTYYIKTSKYKFLIFSFIFSIIGGFFAYLKFSHVRVRVNAWINPEIDPNGISYQVLQGFFSMGSGGLFGSGLYGGNLSLIPVNYTDYILVSIMEEFGVLMGIIIVSLYFLFFFRVFMISLFSEYISEVRLLTLSCVVLISFQAILIISGILNLIPLTGVTLPFISYGGSSIVSMFIIFSLIQKGIGGINKNE